MSKRTTLIQAGKELKNVLVSMNEAVTGVVVVAIVIIALLLWVLSFSVQLLMVFAILVVVSISLIVYANTNNFGESALALVAGLLTVFSIEWDSKKFIAFLVAWFGFSLLSLIISSVKLASKTESIFRQAAIALSSDSEDTYKVERRLKDISKQKELRMLGPVEKAESIRIMAFRRMPVESIEKSIIGVEVLSTITMVDPKNVTEFLADVYRILEVISGTEYSKILDYIVTLLRESPASPSEYFAAFDNSKRLVLAKRYTPEEYFSHLQRGLESGVPASEMNEYLLRGL